MKQDGFTSKTYYREHSYFTWVPKLVIALIVLLPAIILTISYYIGGIIPVIVLVCGALINLYDEVYYPKNINQMPVPRKQRCKVKDNAPSVSKKVAVIGAGPCGLVTAKELLDEGHDVVCYEGADRVGGTFYSYIWPGGRLVSSAYVTCFSDFEPPRKPDGTERWDHLSALEYVEYMEAYAANFNVTKRIRFSTKVVHVKRDVDGKYWMQVSVNGGKAAVEGPFDHVAVCTGAFHVPHVPQIPGIETFTGKIRHTRDFGAKPGTPLEEAFADCAGKNVVALGLGESLADVLYLISCRSKTPTKSCTVSIRYGVFLVPRLHIKYKTVTDLATTRTRHAIPKYLRSLLHVIPLIMTSMFDVRLCTRTRLYAYCTRHLKNFRAIYNKSTKSDDFSLAVEEGKLAIKGMMDRIDKDTIYFKDGSKIENVDVFIYGTGYWQPVHNFFDKDSFPNEAAKIKEMSNEKTPMLENGKCGDGVCDEDIPLAICATRRYLRIFDPNFGDSIAFIGLGVRPVVGAIPPIAEQQARLFALVVSGKRVLPTPENMRRRIKTDLKNDTYEFARDNEYWQGLVNHIQFMDILGREIGNLPKRSYVYCRPVLLWKMMMGGPFPAHYRLNGPHAKTEWARDVIMRGPVQIPSLNRYGSISIKIAVAMVYWPVTLLRLSIDTLDGLYNFVVRT